MNSTTQLKEYVVTRRFVVGVVVFGVGVSVAVNQLDAHAIIDKGIAGWPPLGLLLALEILARAPWGAGRLKTTARVLATIAIAAGAGWLSYWHMVPAVEAHGETTAHNGAYIWPATVDGLMVIAAVAMVELGTRIRALKASIAEEHAAVTSVAASVLPPVPPVVVPAAPALPPVPAYVPPVVVPTPVVAEAEEIARQAARMDPIAAAQQREYWGKRLGARRKA